MIQRQHRLQILHALIGKLVAIRVQGQSNIPVSGGAILICNHTDYIDAVIQGLYSVRELTYLAKAELLDEDWLTRLQLYRSEIESAGLPPEILEILDESFNLASQMLDDLNILPIIRNYRSGNATQNQAYYETVLRAAEEILNEGQILVIYPEGQRSSDGRIQEFKGFAARLAIQCRVPVIPSAIIGAHGFSDPVNWVNGENLHRTIHYRVGTVIPAASLPKKDTKKNIKSLTAKMHTAVCDLQE
ncbi:MAG: 1-acyl-sn-glycerol-3-phosphate acyltransferase [Leptospiraceae bacterium]|nr:1-acyl-sn-glycerol-3-phosphate acyltransferase [Leptospiraceae bacterium]